MAGKKVAMVLANFGELLEGEKKAP